MQEERKKILEMLSEGKIDVDEANDLIATLEKSDNRHQQKPVKKEKSGMLKVLVKEGDKEKVDISLPLSLARLLIKSIPENARSSIIDAGIDIDELIDRVEEGTEDGTLVNINDGKDHIEIKII